MGRHRDRLCTAGQEPGVAPALMESEGLTEIAVGPAIPLCHLLKNMHSPPKGRNPPDQRALCKLGCCLTSEGGLLSSVVDAIYLASGGHQIPLSCATGKVLKPRGGEFTEWQELCLPFVHSACSFLLPRKSPAG